MKRNLLACTAAIFVLGSCIRLDEPSFFTCETDGDCGEDERCRNRYQCVPRACKSADDCDLGQGCRDSTCVPAECSYSFDECPDRFSCDTERRVCRSTCSKTEPCASPALCTEDGSCMIECTSAGQCEGYACSRGMCLNTCSGSADCDVGYSCDPNMTCQPHPGSTPRANGATCTVDTECGSGHCCVGSAGMPRCTASACTKKTVGFACTLAAECASNRCVGGRCGGVDGPVGAICADDLGCLSSNCCRNKCIATGETCPAGDFGQACRSMSDCVLGLMCRDTEGGTQAGTCGSVCSASVLCRSPNARLPATCVEDSSGDGECRAFCSATNTCDPPSTCRTTRNIEGESVQACIPP